MKNIFFFFFLTLSTALYSQYFEDGYIVKKDNTTIYAPISISFNGKYLKIIENDKKVKFEKTQLKDYGYIVDGKKETAFAETAFSMSAYAGYYILSNEPDTLECFITNWNSKHLKGYSRNKEKLNFSTKDKLESYSVVRENKKTIWFDKIAYTPSYPLEKLFQKDSVIAFVERKIDGKIRYYNYIYHVYNAPLTVNNKAVLVTENTPKSITPLLHTYTFHIFKKNEKHYTILEIENHTRETKKQQRRREMKEKEAHIYLMELFKEHPSLLFNIERHAYKLKDLKRMVKEYNATFQ